MSFSPIVIYQATMAADTKTATVHFRNAYKNIYLECPTMSTYAERAIYGSSDGTVYRRAKWPLASGLSAPGNMTIASTVTNFIMKLDFHTKYLQIVATSTVAADSVYKFHCS